MNVYNKLHKRLLQGLLWIFCWICTHHAVLCQSTRYQNVQTPTNTIDTLNKKRLNTLLISGGTSYILGSTGLYLSWYQDYPRSNFHFFDDLSEWQQMDKVGHIYSSYAQSELIYRGLRWSGVSEDQAIGYGILGSALAQTTIEVMDGFSSEWGFSLGDFGANILGLASFGLQQKIWQEQRFRLKFSTTPRNYDALADRLGSEINLSNRAQDLYGNTALESMLKDYNAQTYWLSVNPASFYSNTWIPDWLNIAVGYGADNMFGGFDNSWEHQGEIIDINLSTQRYRQFYISLDLDLDRINTNSKIIRTLLDIFNYIKVPFSAIEINTLGQVKFHLIHF